MIQLGSPDLRFWTHQPIFSETPTLSSSTISTFVSGPGLGQFTHLLSLLSEHIGDTRYYYNCFMLFPLYHKCTFGPRWNTAIVMKNLRETTLKSSMISPWTNGYIWSLNGRQGQHLQNRNTMESNNAWPLCLLILRFTRSNASWAISPSLC